MIWRSLGKGITKDDPGFTPFDRWGRERESGTGQKGSKPISSGPTSTSNPGDASWFSKLVKESIPI